MKTNSRPISDNGSDAIELHLLDDKECSTRVFSAVQRIIIGKSPSCDLVLEGRGVSRRHCIMEQVDGTWMLRDLGSTNGTKINAIHIGGRNPSSNREPHSLSCGDVLTIGESRIQLFLGHSTDRTEILDPPPLSPDLPTVQCESPVPDGEPLNQIPAKSASALHNPNRGMALGDPSVTTLPGVHSDVAQRMEFPRDFRQYRLIQRVGEGGMGDVVLATERRNPRQHFAIKFLKPLANQSGPDRSRFLREMSISMSLRHKSLVHCIECGEQDGQLFIVMEYYAGGNLAQWLERVGSLTERRAIRLLAKLLDGIAYAHSKGVIHRDLKPSNILLQKIAERKYVPRISDFGLAKSFLNSGESGMTVDGAIGGTWGYMPKEQLMNFRYVLPQSDVWSIGAILYETLTLELPRPHVPGSDPVCCVLESNVRPIEDLLPGIDRRLAKFLHRCLATEPEERFADGREMKKSLFYLANQMGIPI